jgi:hypothetical protein
MKKHKAWIVEITGARREARGDKNHEKKKEKKDRRVVIKRQVSNGWLTAINKIWGKSKMEEDVVHARIRWCCRMKGRHRKAR